MTRCTVFKVYTVFENGIVFEKGIVFESSIVFENGIVFELLWRIGKIALRKMRVFGYALPELEK